MLGLDQIEVVYLPLGKLSCSSEVFSLMCFFSVIFYLLGIQTMFCDKASRYEDNARESGERLLAEEEGALWTRNESSLTPTCKNFATGLLQMTALVLVFLVGTLFGFHWRGDLDGLCREHVSQYCKAYTKLLPCN